MSTEVSNFGVSETSVPTNATTQRNIPK